MTKTTKKEIKLRDGSMIPANASVELTLLGSGIVAKHGGKEIKLGYRNAFANFGAPFTKEPSLGTMERWSNSGIAKSTTGARVEPDGHGADGSPSWMLVLGLI